MLNKKAMIKNVELILEYVALTLRSNRFKYQLFENEKENKITISLISNIDELLLEKINTSTSIIEFKNSESNANHYSDKINKYLDSSVKEFNQIKLMLDNINGLDYTFKYILIKGVLLNDSIIEICRKLNIGKSTYYHRLHEAKFMLSLSIPECYRLDKLNK